MMLGGGCTGVVAAPDEGAGSSTGVAICSSNVYWKDLDKPSELMRPGGKCIACHMKSKMGSIFAMAGTVYPTSHEPDECNGVGGTMNDAGMAEITIVITDATGRTKEPVPVNSVGNFQFTNQIIAPFWVKVVARGKENKMVAQTPHGDCNVCHTQTGAEGAPGRVVAP